MLHPGREKHIQIGDLLADSAQSGDVAPEPEHGKVHERVDPGGGDAVQLLDRLEDARVLVPARVVVRGGDLGAEAEDVPRAVTAPKEIPRVDRAL